MCTNCALIVPCDEPYQRPCTRSVPLVIKKGYQNTPQQRVGKEPGGSSRMVPDVLVNHTLPGELCFIRPSASDWRSVNACHFMFFEISKTEFRRAKHHCISIRSCVSLPAICFRLAICECIPPSHPENSHTSKLQKNQKLQKTRKTAENSKTAEHL